MGRIYAGVLGLLAFTTFVVRGLMHSGGPGLMLSAAAMLMAFAFIGWLIGTIAETTVRDSVEATFDAEVAALEAENKTKPARA
jgi:hypothetical protein